MTKKKGLPKKEPKARAPGRTTLTPEKKEHFLAVLRETANVTAGARAIGVGRAWMYHAGRDKDAKFAEAWDAALEEAVDALEGEARRRGFSGVDEPVHYKGERVDTIKRYSDVLLIFLLKAHRPEKFREKFEHSGPGGGPMQIEHLVALPPAELAQRVQEAAARVGTRKPD